MLQAAIPAIVSQIFSAEHHTLRFDDRIVVLTGIGREGQVGEMVARRLAELGASIIAVDKTAKIVRERVTELQEAGFKAEARTCDLARESEVRALASAIRRRHNGQVHALVLMAGGFASSGPVIASNYRTWQRQFTINLTTAYLTTRSFLPMLRRTSGSIVYFASAAALPAAEVANISAYAAAKSGVLTLMRAVAKEEHAHGVRANALAPKAIGTSSNIKSMGKSADYVSREDVAAVVTMLCSEVSRPVTGQIIALG